MGHPLGSNLTLLFLFFTSFNKGSFSYISDKKPVSISIRERTSFLNSSEVEKQRELGICSPCQSRGWGICKFCAARGPGICQLRTFDTHAVSYQNITTLRILLEKQAHLSRTCFRFYACISSLLIKPELDSEIGSYRRESKSFGLLNQISLDVISRTSFHIYKTIHNS